MFGWRTRQNDLLPPSLLLFPGPFFLSRPSIPFPVYPFPPPPPQIAGRAKREGGRFADSSPPTSAHISSAIKIPPPRTVRFFFVVDGQSSLMTLGDCRADARRTRCGLRPIPDTKKKPMARGGDRAMNVSRSVSKGRKRKRKKQSGLPLRRLSAGRWK